MEKFSNFRDNATGIQPFLAPVPAPNTAAEFWYKLLLPLRVILGLIRTTIVTILFVLHFILAEGLCSFLLPIPPLHRVLTGWLCALFLRSILFTLGFIFIPVEYVTSKRGKPNKTSEKWNPRPGDLIVSNYVSWIEILWLAYRFNPIFVFPVQQSAAQATVPATIKPAVSYIPGRRSGNALSASQAPGKKPTERVDVSGSFVRVSLFTALRITGKVPPYGLSVSKPERIEDISRNCTRPIAVFPELTTTNGRGLARFAVISQCEVPVKNFNVFLMCIRYDPPTTFSPTLSHSIPSTSCNPLPHVFKVASSFSVPKISFRLLNPSESPSSSLFITSNVTSETGESQFTDVCAALIAQIGKMKRMAIGWEDKAEFLRFYRSKNRV